MSLFDCLSSLPSLLAPTSPSPTLRSRSGPPPPVDLLLLGSGWTSSFVLPLAADAGLRCASTTRAGSGGTIGWTFDPDASDADNALSFRVLPDAKAVLVVFPLYDEGAAERLVRGYLASRGAGDGDGGGDPDPEKDRRGRDIEDVDTRFILLGSTGIYDNGPTLTRMLAPLSPPCSGSGQGQSFAAAKSPQPQLQASSPFSAEKHKHKHGDKPPSDSQSPWLDASSPYFPLPRALAEDAFLSLSRPSNPVRRTPIPTTVLLLCGLWGHGRSARNLIARLPPSKDVFRNLASVHLVHGRDVARAVLALSSGERFEQAKAGGRRWVLTNGRVYDLWDLAAQFGSAGEGGRNHAPTGPFPKLVDELT